MAKLVKRLKTVMKPYRFFDNNLVTILSLLGQFKRACDFNKVSKDVVTWVLSFHMAKSPATLLVFRIAPNNEVDSPVPVRQKNEGQERIYTYIEAVNNLLNSYATDNVFEKASMEIKFFKKILSQMAVLFFRDIRDKAL